MAMDTIRERVQLELDSQVRRYQVLQKDLEDAAQSTLESLDMENIGEQERRSREAALKAVNDRFEEEAAQHDADNGAAENDEADKKSSAALSEINEKYARECVKALLEGVPRVKSLLDASIKALKQEMPFNAEQSKFVQDFDARIARLDDEANQNPIVAGDGDILIERPRELRLICPLTKATFEDPVQSTDCKHTFSRAALKHYLGKSRTAVKTCPIPGCGKDVSLATVEPNSEIARALKRAAVTGAKRKRAGGASGAAGADADDDFIDV